MSQYKIIYSIIKCINIIKFSKIKKLSLHLTVNRYYSKPKENDFLLNFLYSFIIIGKNNLLLIMNHLKINKLFQKFTVEKHFSVSKTI